MKIVKLIGILLIIVAAIIGAIYLPDLFGESEDDNFVSTDLVDVNIVRNDFISQWENAKTWDEALHKEQRDKVLRYKNNQMLSKASYEALLNIIRETVINKVCNTYNDALKASPSNHRKITNAYSNISKVKKVEGLDTIASADHRIARVEKLHKYYCNVRSFAESSHRMSATLDTIYLTWKSFDELKQVKLSTANSYRNNTLYSEVSHIDAIVNGLKETEVVRKVEQQRLGFYSSLYNAILEHFNSLEITRENLRKLNSVRNGAFEREAPKNYKDMLLDYYFEYEERVEKLEESSNT